VSELNSCFGSFVLRLLSSLSVSETGCHQPCAELSARKAQTVKSVKEAGSELASVSVRWDELGGVGSSFSAGRTLLSHCFAHVARQISRVEDKGLSVDLLYVYALVLHHS